MAQRPAVLAVYRELVELTRKLPAPDVGPALQEARAAVRRHAGEADPMVVSDLLKRMVARVTLLRMTTPRGPRDRRSRIGVEHFVMRDGVLQPGAGRADSRCGRGADELWCGWGGRQGWP